MEKFTVDHQHYYFKELSEMPEEFKSFQIKGSMIKYVQGHFGKVLCQQIVLDNFEIQHSTYRIREDCICRLTGRKHWLGIHITLKTDHYCLVPKPATGFVKESQCRFVYMPSSITSNSFQKGKEYVCLDLSYSPSQLKPFETLFPFAKSLIKGLKMGTPVSLCRNTFPVSSAIRNIIQEILHSSYQGEIQRAYLKIKASELLFHLIGLPFEIGDGTVRLNESHRGKLYEAKKFIEDNYRHHYSIYRMARKYGMNTTTFKAGFREQFGMGPFELLVKIRMEKAIELLKERRLAVNQIADVTGYQSFGSFIKAFKKRFNCTPGQMRKTAR